MVQLYEKGYGKDSAGIAMEAINYGKGQGQQLCVCLGEGGYIQQWQTMVQLYKKGNGKDSAGIAIEVINFGKGQCHQL